MPLATVTLSLEGDGKWYRPIAATANGITTATYEGGSESIELPASLTVRVPTELWNMRLRKLSQAAAAWTPSPFFNVLPFLAPWLMIFPVLAVARDSAGTAAATSPPVPLATGQSVPLQSQTGASDSTDWTALIVVCTIAFFVCMAAGPVWIHKCLVKRHEALRMLIDEFTMADAVQTDRHVVWRFQLPAGCDSLTGIGEWHPSYYETNIEVVVLGPADCLDEQGNIISLDAIFGAQANDGGVHRAIECGDIVDPPPAYTAVPAPSEKPPEYSLMPLTLFDAEYELHAVADNGSPAPVPSAAPAADASERSRAGSSSSPPHLAIAPPLPPAVARARSGSTVSISSDFEEVNVTTLAAASLPPPPPRSTSLLRSTTATLGGGFAVLVSEVRATAGRTTRRSRGESLVLVPSPMSPRSDEFLLSAATSPRSPQFLGSSAPSPYCTEFPATLTVDPPAYAIVDMGGEDAAHIEVDLGGCSDTSRPAHAQNAV